MTQSFADPGVFGGGDVTRTATVNLNANVSGYSSQMGQAAQQTGALSSAVDGLSNRMTQLHHFASRKLFQFSAADFAALSGATADAATFQKQLSTLNATSAITGTSMKGLKGGIESAFTSLPVSRTSVIALTEAITNMGVTSARDIGQLTQTFIKLGASTGEPMDQLASGLIQLSREMGATNATQIGNFANALLTVSKNAGVSATGVLQFSQAIAPMARQAGISEAAVLGISTAFSKAGADGYVAANTFNSILSDISSSIATGGPELAKYANLIGKTQDQFRAMDRTTAITSVFNALGRQGSQQLAVFNDLGISSVRGQSAIAAVTQSGGLQQAISQAEGAQGNQRNLNKGASAAFDGLADAGIRVRNELTQAGTEIGTTFLTPMTAVVDTLAKVAALANSAMKPFAPLIGALGATAGVAGVVGGTAMNLTGAIGAYALFRYARRGVGTVTAGGRAQRAMMGGRDLNAADEAMMARYTAPAGDPNRMGRFERLRYEMGMGVGRMLGPQTEAPTNLSALRQFSTWRNLGIMAPFRVISAFNNQQAEFLRGSLREAGQGMRVGTGGRVGFRQNFRNMIDAQRGLSAQDVAGQEARNMLRSVGNVTGANVQVGSQMAAGVARRAWGLVGPGAVTSLLGGLLTGVPGTGRIANQIRARIPDDGVHATGASFGVAAKDFGRSFGDVARMGSASFKALATSSKELGAAFGRLAGASVKAGASMAVSAGGRAISTVASTAWQAGGALLRGAFSLPGMAAITGGSWLYGRLRDHAKIDDSQYLNPIQKYNDELGTTTSNLASFSDALTVAAKQASTSASTTMKSAETVTQSDIAGAPSKPMNAEWSAAAKYGKGNSKLLVGLLSNLQISDPRQLQAAKEDMLAAGIDPDTVQQVLSRYTAAGGPNAMSGIGTATNYSTIGKAVVNTEGRGGVMGIGGRNASKSGTALLDAAYSGIGGEEISDAQTKGSAYASQRALMSQVQLMQSLIAHTGEYGAGGRSQQTQATIDALAHYASKVTGGGEDGYRATLAKGQHGVHITGDMTPEQLQQQVIYLLQSTGAGRRYLNRVTNAGGTIDPRAMQQQLINLSNTGNGGDFNALLRNSGPLGRFAASNQQVQSAIGLQQDNTAVTQRSTDLIMRQAEQLGGGLSGAVGKLMDFQAAIGDSTSALDKQVSAALQLVLQQQQYSAPFQTRAQQFHGALDTYQSATSAWRRAEATNNPDADELYKTQQQAKASYEQSLASQQQFLQSLYQQAQQYGTQRTRESEDENRQIYRSQLSFQIQMSQAQQDYLIQRQRTQEAHDRQMADQAQQAAQSIYSPYTRVAAQYTADAGTLEQNLEDQNQRIAQQRAQLDQLHRMGVSTQAIRTLNLADPSNAQQLNATVTSLMQNPELVSKINREVATRLTGTRALTQSTYNLQFVQGQRDFDIQLSQTAADYDRQTTRAKQAQSLAMSQMAEDYSIMINRSAADLNTAMQEITGNFGSMFSKTMGMIDTQLGTYAPKAAKTIETQLDNLVKKYPYLLTGDASSTPDPGLKAKPGIVGYNAQRQVGQYDANGGWHPFTGPVDKSRLHRVYNPVTGHRMGGTSVGEHAAWISEGNRKETIIPLEDSRSVGYLAAVLTKSLAQVVVSAGAPQRALSGSTHVDASTNFTGPVQVVADDPNKMARQLAAKARLAKLRMPPRSTAG